MGVGPNTIDPSATATAMPAFGSLMSRYVWDHSSFSSSVLRNDLKEEGTPTEYWELELNVGPFSPSRSVLVLKHGRRNGDIIMEPNIM